VMSKQFYEALGPDRSKKAFVHYPAGTYPDQVDELKRSSSARRYFGSRLRRRRVLDRLVEVASSRT